MESAIVKQTIKMGNSSCVILPKRWKYKKVRVELVDDSITRDLFEILTKMDLLKEVIGIYLVGSYARGEESLESDIDVLIITENTDKQLKEGIYEIVFVSKEKFDKNIKKNLYLVSLVKESRSILNDDFIKDYKNIKFQIPLKKYLSEIKSMMKLNEDVVEGDKEIDGKVSDGIVYSVVLRLRELYLIYCLLKNKKGSKNEFLKIIEDNGSLELYEAYLRIKNNKTAKDNSEPEQVKKLVDYSKKIIKKLR